MSMKQTAARHRPDRSGVAGNPIGIRPHRPALAVWVPRGWPRRRHPCCRNCRVRAGLHKKIHDVPPATGGSGASWHIYGMMRPGGSHNGRLSGNKGADAHQQDGFVNQYGRQVIKNGVDDATADDGRHGAENQNPQLSGDCHFPVILLRWSGGLRRAQLKYRTFFGAYNNCHRSCKEKKVGADRWPFRIGICLTVTADAQRSMIMAMPMPPPMHIDIKPVP